MPLDNPQIDPVLAAELLIRRLCRPIASVPGNCVAVAETETPFGGDDWFWTDETPRCWNSWRVPRSGSAIAGTARAS